jgi:extracellular factor (EF) 3-hydroxypalmitic acid methyl ester biosynthesis protein
MDAMALAGNPSDAPAAPDGDGAEDCAVALKRRLGVAATYFAEGDFLAGCSALDDGIWPIRAAAGGDTAWKNAVSLNRGHAVHKTAGASTFVRYAREKPRGYPGDAVLMDMIYGIDGHGLITTETSEARQISCHWLSHPTAEAVRRRRRRFASYIDGAARHGRPPDVFSVACGHARECDLSEALKNGEVGSFVGMDHDQNSLEIMQSSIPVASTSKSRPLHASVLTLLSHENDDLGPFDLIYSAGLYDYLDQPTARRLCEALFALLRPGGRLVIANFLRKAKGAAVMECIMDWWLVYRSEAEIRDLSANLRQGDIASVEYVEDIDEVGYLAVKRVP